MNNPNIFVFCYPKPWIPAFETIQKTAILSWKKALPSNAVVVLLGDETGTQEAAAALDCCYDACPGKNEWGTPLVSAIFETINRVTPTTAIACYINADIVLGFDFWQTVLAVQRHWADKREEPWLLIGKRTDVTIAELNDGMSVDQIQEIALTTGCDHGWAGIDYFVFPANTFRFVYPFALGKFVWDQWLVGNAFRRGMFTVDGSSTVLAVHLNCDWYFQGKLTKDRLSIDDSEEGKRNRSFDYYQKTIISGTLYQTARESGSGQIIVRKKTWVPDE